jgi:hypothetical protein
MRQELFRGGLILPGFDLMRAALASNTAQLPLADGVFRSRAAQHHGRHRQRLPAGPARRGRADVFGHRQPSPVPAAC